MTQRRLELVDVEDGEEPSVTSSDPNERKLARRLRIQRRLDALTKHERTQDEEVVEKNPIERQMLASSDLLEKLQAEGEEVVSSVKVANDARELQRRKEEREIRMNLLKKLEEEDRECMRKYNEISEKWPNILESNDPLDIHSEMAEQSAKCLEILAKKDAVIAELRRELENADVKFVEDQKKQNEDINLLTERMDSQANIIAKAYRRELALIDDVIDSERKVLLATVAEKWEALYKKIQDDDQEGIEKRKEIMRKYEEEMNRVIVEHQEEFRAQRIKLEVECEKLQQEVQNTKNLCMMNIEKLDYSYAVLKRREDENTVVRNQQKRRINKLQDVISGLKKSYADLEEKTRAEIRRLTDEVLNAHKNILELEEKSERFTNINESKYLQIWDMNVEAANELVDKILTADRIIYEQILGLEWRSPEVPLLTKEDLPSYQAAVAVIRKRKQEVDERKRISDPRKPASTLQELNLERRMLNHIIKCISDRTGYLVEDSLRDLLLPYTANDNIVIRLDNVFQALDIKSEEEIHYILNFFLPYTYCPTCTAATLAASTVSAATIQGPKSSETTGAGPDLCEDGEKFTDDEIKLIAAVKQEISVQPPCNDVSEISASSEKSRSSRETCSCDEEDGSVRVARLENAEDDDSDKKSRLLCDKGHLLEIRTVYVTRALKEFVERYHFVKHEEVAPSLKEKLTKKRHTISRSLTAEDVSMFWNRYRDIFPAEKERLWDGLLVGLKKYHGVLKERHQLNAETESLRRQNAELRRLLKTYNVEPGSSDLMEEEVRSSTAVL